MIRVVTTVAALAMASAAGAVPVMSDWTSNFEGTLDGVGFTFAPTVPDGSVSVTDFNDPGHAAHPVTSVEARAYEPTDSITVTFDQPVSNLLVYASFWRGNGDAVGSGGTTGYTFDQTTSLLSSDGFSPAAPSTGTSFGVALPGFGDGIFAIGNPVSSLSIASTFESTTPQTQFITFGKLDSATPIPLPAAAWFLLAGLGALALLRRRAA